MNKDPKTYTVDFTSLQSEWDVHPILKEALDFPDYYGHNWDAFWDCLFEVEGNPLHIRILGMDVLRRLAPQRADMLIDILTEYIRFHDDLPFDIQIELIDGDRHTFIS